MAGVEEANQRTGNVRLKASGAGRRKTDRSCPHNRKQWGLVVRNEFWKVDTAHVAL